MATTAKIVKSKKKPKFSTRIVRRCFRCGRARGYMRRFGLCRICFREMANRGLIPGVKIVGAATLNDLVLEVDATQWF